jgi:hypothetical protein
MLSRPLGAILAVLVGVTAAPAQPAPFPGLPPEATTSLDGGVGVSDGGILSTDPEPYRWWLSGEYLLGFVKGTGTPTVVTAGTVNSGGILGQPGTRGLFGGPIDYDGLSGARFSGGMWLDSCRAYALDWSVFYLPRQQTTATFTAAPGEVLARPFFDTALNIENSRRVAAPGLFTGSVSVDYRSLFWGGELGARLRVVETPTFSLEQLFHFRYYALEESFQAVDTSTALGGGVVTFNGQAFRNPATVRVNDYISVTNRFYGGSAGLRALWTPGRFEFRLDGRLAVGAVAQQVNIDGTTSISDIAAGQTVAGPTTVRPGFYTAAQIPSKFTNYRFSLAPDVQARIGYRVTDWLTVTAGYQFVYITDVARAGDQIVRRINPGQIPSSQNFGAAAPALQGIPNIVSTDYWMHGLTAGLMLTF